MAIKMDLPLKVYQHKFLILILNLCIGEMKTAFSLWLIAYKNIHKPTNDLATELKSHLLYEKDSK